MPTIQTPTASTPFLQGTPNSLISPVWYKALTQIAALLGAGQDVLTQDDFQELVATTRQTPPLNIPSGLYVLSQGGTLTDGAVDGGVVTEAELVQCIAQGSFGLTYTITPGESDDNAASTAWVVGGLLGGGNNTTQYTNVISSPGRAAGTIYTTGIYSRVVSVSIGTVNTSDIGTLSIDGDVIDEINGNGLGGARYSLFGIVPPDTGYEVNLTGSATLLAWFEW